MKCSSSDGIPAKLYYEPVLNGRTNQYRLHKVYTLADIDQLLGDVHDTAKHANDTTQKPASRPLKYLHAAFTYNQTYTLASAVRG